MAMLGMTPKVKSLVENFNSTDESIRSLSETLDKFTFNNSSFHYQID